MAAALHAIAVCCMFFFATSSCCCGGEIRGPRGTLGCELGPAQTTAYFNRNGSSRFCFSAVPLCVCVRVVPVCDYAWYLTGSE